MKMVDGKLVSDDTPENKATGKDPVTGAENGDSKAADLAKDSFVVPPATVIDPVTGKESVAEVKTEPAIQPVGGHQLSPKPTPDPINAGKAPESVRGNKTNKGDLPVESGQFQQPDSLNLNKHDGELKTSDRPANSGPMNIRDEFKAHPPEQVSNAQARTVTALTEAKIADSPQNDDKRYTGAQKLGLIEQALKNKGLDSMQLINAMAEIKAILNW